jgi:hypothetical protein
MAGTGWDQQVVDNALRYRRLHERVARISITESSRDGTVEVTVSTTGVITDLVLRERRRPTFLPEVAAQIMECVRRAQARIPDLLREAVFDTIGRDDPSTHLLLADARQRFPEPPSARDPHDVRDRARFEREPDDEPAAPPAYQVHARKPVAKRPVDDEDDWEDPVVMEDG